MDLRGIVLIGFSMACLGVAGLAYQQKKQLDLTAGLSNARGASHSSCRGSSVQTNMGRLSCIQRTSGFFSGTDGIRMKSGGGLLSGW